MRRINQPKITIPAQQPRDYRKELWMGVAVVVAGAVTSPDKVTPVVWADFVLAAFDERFKGEAT